MKDALSRASLDDERIGASTESLLRHPELDPSRYYAQVAEHPYFPALTLFRHHIKEVSDAYFSQDVDARNIDLFMMTSSVSSPSGPGSDSEPIPLTFGGLDTYLVDSSQFGFEPILVGGIPRAYCYLASMRGENPDARHLNQFYHCEYEGQTNLAETQRIAEGYVKALCSLMRSMPSTLTKLSADPDATECIVAATCESDTFPEVTFDEAAQLLARDGRGECIRSTDHGDDITAEGERELLRLLKAGTPVWITRYHRDRVPFYQKPSAENADRVLNADLICPAIVGDGFSGEFLGLGQRQDSPEELYESMKRQGVDSAPYEWYVDLRRMPNYKLTSGFGLGIERFIAWMLGLDSIHKAILYPRMKGTHMNP